VQKIIYLLHVDTVRGYL